MPYKDPVIAREKQKVYRARWYEKHGDRVRKEARERMATPEIRQRELLRSRQSRSMRQYQAIEYLGGKCLDCGYFENCDALEFDHRDGRNGAQCISELWNWAWERLRVELDKCDLVCANCHSIRTRQREREAWQTKQTA